MATSVIVWQCITIFCYIFQPVCTGTAHTSKACYGNSAISCARHAISCNSTQRIAIVDAYYTNNTECGQGLANCAGVNPDSVRERRHRRFNKAELVSLYNNCSTKFQCVYPAPRRGTVLAFSVVKYQCIETSGPFNVKCETETVTSTGTNTGITVDHVSSTKDNSCVSTEYSTKTTVIKIVPSETRDNGTHTAEERGNNTGAIIGGVVGTAVLVVTLVSVVRMRKRRVKSEGKEKTAKFPLDVEPDTKYSLAGKIPQNNYHEIQDLKTLGSDYDYANADGLADPPSAHTYFTIEPAEKQNVKQSSTSSTTECDYDHIGDKQSPQTSDYDTTASVAQHAHTGGTIGEDDYGYNLFHKKTNSQTHQNDYDTAASATKAVAQLDRTDRNTDDDDYDHFPSVTNYPETVSSPYDTASEMGHN